MTKQRRTAARLLLEARRRAGITQAELSRRSGVPHSVISNYETGRREPGTEALARLLAATGHDISLRPRKVDVERAGWELVQVLDLAEHLPQKRRGPLRYPKLG